MGIDADAAAQTVEVQGVGHRLADPSGGVTGATTDIDIDARQSGTTARFLAPVLALGPGHCRLDGADSLRRRSMAPIIELMREAGVEVAEEGEAGHLPIRIRGWRLWPSELSVDASVSSQFVSGLLMAAPYFSVGLDLALTGSIVSRPYLDMTVDVMKAFGAMVEPLGDRAYRVESGVYRGAPGTSSPMRPRRRTSWRRRRSAAGASSSTDWGAGHARATLLSWTSSNAWARRSCGGTRRPS